MDVLGLKEGSDVADIGAGSAGSLFALPGVSEVAAEFMLSKSTAITSNTSQLAPSERSSQMSALF